MSYNNLATTFIFSVLLAREDMMSGIEYCLLRILVN